MTMICKTCFEIHGRDTNQPVKCPSCGKLFCFLHMNMPCRDAHSIRKCAKMKADSITEYPIIEIENQLKK